MGPLKRRWVLLLRRRRSEFIVIKLELTLCNLLDWVVAGVSVSNIVCIKYGTIAGGDFALQLTVRNRIQRKHKQCWLRH